MVLYSDTQIFSSSSKIIKVQDFLKTCWNWMITDRYKNTFTKSLFSLTSLLSYQAHKHLVNCRCLICCKLKSNLFNTHFKLLLERNATSNVVFHTIKMNQEKAKLNVFLKLSVKLQKFKKNGISEKDSVYFGLFFW